MDALTLLEQDHQKVKKLMGEIEKTTERGIKTREQLFNKLVEEGKYGPKNTEFQEPFWHVLSASLFDVHVR